jgi:hypothetical protein
MNTDQTIAEVLPRIKTAILRLQEAVSALPSELTTKPVLSGERSVRDVIVHLTWWDQWLLTTLPPLPGAEPLPFALPLADQIPPGDQWAEAMNAKVLRYSRACEFSAAWRELQATCDLLIDRVSRLTDADMREPSEISAQIGYPLAPLITGIYEHYEEHAEELEQIGK